MKHLLATFLSIALAGLVAPAQGEPPAPEVRLVKAQGTIRTRDADGRVSGPLAAGARVPPGHSVETDEGGRAVIRLGNSDVIVLGGKSRVKPESENGAVTLLRQVSGWIYYAFGKRDKSATRVAVATPVATIGVRGTRFAVEESDTRKAIAMRKGEVSVESVKGEFELYRKQGKDDFDAWRQAQEADAEKVQEEFKRFREDTAKEFAEYVRSFKLGADREVSFDGSRAKESALSPRASRDMADAEAFAAEWLSEVRD